MRAGAALWDSDDPGGESGMGTAASTVAVSSDNGSEPEYAPLPFPLVPRMVGGG